MEDYIQSREDREKFKRLGIEIERTKEKERRKTATKEVARFRERVSHIMFSAIQLMYSNNIIQHNCVRLKGTFA